VNENEMRQRPANSHRSQNRNLRDPRDADQTAKDELEN
jgi:hypothetical protein